MGQNDHTGDNGDFTDFLQRLINRGVLEGAAEGITKFVIDKGLQRLTPKQMYVFNQYVLGEYVFQECSRCSNEITWSEMSAALDNGGLCNYCWHMSEKAKDE